MYNKCNNVRFACIPNYPNSTDDDDLKKDSLSQILYGSNLFEKNSFSAVRIPSVSEKKLETDDTKVNSS